MKKQKKPLSKGMKIGIVVILVVAVAVLGVSVYKLLGINQSYKEANDLYDDVAALAMSEDGAEDSTEVGPVTGDDTNAQAGDDAGNAGTAENAAAAGGVGEDAQTAGSADAVGSTAENAAAADGAGAGAQTAGSADAVGNVANNTAAVGEPVEGVVSDTESGVEAALASGTDNQTVTDTAGEGTATPADDAAPVDGTAAPADDAAPVEGTAAPADATASVDGTAAPAATPVEGATAEPGAELVETASIESAADGDAVVLSAEAGAEEKAAETGAVESTETGEVGSTEISAAEPAVTGTDGAAVAAADAVESADSVPVVTEEFSDSSLFVIGGRRWADPEKLQRYADAASGKPEITAFSGIGRSSMAWNYKALHDKYPDTVGWIYQKDTMSYPIVMGKDNNQYLRTMIDGKYNVAGTLFVDCEYKKALSGRYSVVYGHNMDDRSMFGSLTDYKDKEYYLEHPYFEIYVGGYMYRYLVYAAMKVEEDSPLLMAPDQMTDEEFLKLIEWVDKEKLYETKSPEITKNSVVTVLATCTEYPRNYAYRNVVVLVRENPLIKK